MSLKQIKFKEKSNFFICPKCKQALVAEESSFRCINNHSFDIAKKGYVNFLLKQRNTDGYNSENFFYRNLILNAGFYDHIADEIINRVDYYSPGNIMDIGCGEGFYSKKLENENRNILAFDFSKDAINIASRGITDILFFIADIGNIPVRDKCMEMILNIYTPANYKEYGRILKDDGIIVKVIPGNDHLKELRKLAAKDLKSEEYDNSDVKNIFSDKCQLIDSRNVKKTYPIAGENLDALINMTPMLFSKDRTSIDKEKISEITIDAEILIGKIK